MKTGGIRCVCPRKIKFSSAFERLSRFGRFIPSAGWAGGALSASGWRICCYAAQKLGQSGKIVGSHPESEAGLHLLKAAALRLQPTTFSNCSRISKWDVVVRALGRHYKFRDDFLLTRFLESYIEFVALDIHYIAVAELLMKHAVSLSE